MNIDKHSSTTIWLLQKRAEADSLRRSTSWLRLFKRVKIMMTSEIHDKKTCVGRNVIEVFGVIIANLKIENVDVFTHTIRIGAPVSHYNDKKLFRCCCNANSGRPDAFLPNMTQQNLRRRFIVFFWRAPATIGNRAAYCMSRCLHTCTADCPIQSPSTYAVISHLPRPGLPSDESDVMLMLCALQNSISSNCGHII